MIEAALALLLLAGAVIAIRRLPIVHPVTLWLVPWALVASLLALHALPYRSLSVSAAALIAGWTAVFCAGALLGARCPLPPSWMQAGDVRPSDTSRVAWAAALAGAIALLGLATFLAQAASLHGVRAAIVSDANVRLSIGEGATPYTIKYIYVAFAAATLAGAAAARATAVRERRLWILAALVFVATQYFSTGRSNILLAAVMACIAYFLSDRGRLSGIRVMRAVAVVGVGAMLIFAGMGSLLDKSFGDSDIQTYDNVFVQNDALQPLALPYQYVTAPLPAFDVVREVTPRWGRGGCRTLSPLCAIGEKVGLPMQAEPSLTGFTANPGGWNTFTALYAPLVDGGPVLGTGFVLAQGVLFGLLWALVSTGSIYAISAYATMSAAVLYSTVENSLLQPHLAGAALIAIGLTAAVARIPWSGRGWRKHSRMPPGADLT